MINKKFKLTATAIGVSIFSSLPSISYAAPVTLLTTCMDHGAMVIPGVALAVEGAKGDCGVVKNVYNFSGDAAAEIDQFGEEIEEAGNAIADAITSNSSSEIEIISKGNETLIKTMVTITNNQIKDQLLQDKMLLDMQMDYETELKERELKASQSIMGMDDTKEEVLFMINELNVVGGGSEGAYNHSQEVIAAMKAKYDDDPTFMMPVRIKAAEHTSSEGVGCADYDPVAHKNGTLDQTCFYNVKASPGAKLEKYFQECSRMKANAISSVQKNVSRTVSAAAQKKSQSNYIKKSQTQKAEDLIASKITTQKETSCSVKEFGYKICGKNENGDQLSKTEYLQEVVDLKTIPYGNVSSSNFLAPVSVGSVDGELGDITDEELNAMALKSLDYKKLDESDPESGPSVAPSSNTPKIDKTYRTSSQYFAAIDFVNNIVNKEAVAGLNITRSTNASNSMFQSKFMARTASLSLAENSLRAAVELRTGTSLNEKIKEATELGDEFKRDSELVREDINGAGALDVIIHLVDKDYNRLQADAKSVISGGGSGQVQTAPNQVNDWQVEALIKSNQLALMQFEQNERIELLLAAMLANATNAEQNINYINSLKLK